MDRSKRFLAIVLLLAVLLGAVTAVAAEFRTLQLGDSGEDVLALKERMYELGYFSTRKFAAEFNETTRERLRELQRKNGLKADGIATPEVQILLFSDECLPKSAKVTAAPKSTAAPEPAQPALTPAPREAAVPAEDVGPDALTPPAGAPALDAEGYLPAGEAAYSLSDRENGVWSYISQDVHVEIRQHSDTTEFGANIWLELSLRLKDPARLISMLSGGKRPGNALVQPHTLLESYGTPIVAFNDDFFGYRVRYKQKKGVIIRSGEILYDDPKPANAKVFPPLDVMAVFTDGSMKTFRSNEHTAQEYLDMGVRDTYAFGPILVRDGVLNEGAAAWATKRAPRLGFGVTADGTVKVVDALGRRTDAKGVSVGWLAQTMYDLGCVEALNLDGGNTTCLIFMGDMINRPVNVASKNIRYITGLIGVLAEE